MGEFDKDLNQNYIKKDLFIGGASHHTIDDEGRVFSVYTPHDPNLNSTAIEIPNPSPELKAQIQQRRTEVSHVLQKVIFDPSNADIEIRQAADRVWLEDNGIDPKSAI